jgi:two-component system sensor histidine kinase KdpD
MAVAAASGVVAALDEVAPVTGLGVIYLLAVMAVAIRRGLLAALASAVVSVLAFNFLFIQPRYRLEISHSRDVVALVVFLIAAVVVGRLAALARERAREAQAEARSATAREREAGVLAATASSVLTSKALGEHRHAISDAVGSATNGGARLAFESAPNPVGEELVVLLPSEGGRAWLYGLPAAGWDGDSLGRLAAPLGRLIDVAREREKGAARDAEAEAARQADIAKTVLLHAISHDLRSPLTAITTAAAALRGEGVPREDRESLLAAVEHEAARLSRLVDDLLDLSRIEAGAVEPQLDWCDLQEVAARAAAQIRERHHDHPIELALPGEMPLVRADQVQLERVFCNLLDNAVKFSPDGAPVRVSGGTERDGVTVRVSDRGKGIPLSRRPHVFEPFVRGRDGGQGSGLGLAICRGFVEANGGEIRLQGTARGTSFAVSFPVEPQPTGIA